MEKVATDHMKAPVSWMRKHHRNRYTRDLDESSSSERGPSSSTTSVEHQLQISREKYRNSHFTSNKYPYPAVHLLCLGNEEQRSKFQITICNSHGQSHLHVYLDDDISFDTCGSLPPSVLQKCQHTSIGKPMKRRKEALHMKATSTKQTKNNKKRTKVCEQDTVVEGDVNDIVDTMSRMMMTTNPTFGIFATKDNLTDSEHNDVTNKVEDLV